MTYKELGLSRREAQYAFSESSSKIAILIKSTRIIKPNHSDRNCMSILQKTFQLDHGPEVEFKRRKINAPGKSRDI